MTHRPPTQPGDDVLEVEHLVAELISVGVNNEELISEGSSEDGLRDGHSHVAIADHKDLVVALGRRGRSHVGY